jgi:hypothetical protein
MKSSAIFGNVVVDHVGHVIAVQATRCDVGRDQHLVAAFLKSAQGALRCDCVRSP